MLFITFALSIPLCTLAIKLSENRGPFPRGRHLQERNESWSEDMKTTFQNGTLVRHTSGYLRMDLFDWVRDVWIQAQILPIGTCFKEGYYGGSAKLAEVIIAEGSVYHSTNSYESPDCTGDFVAYPYSQPVTDSDRQLEQKISHVFTFEEAVQLIPKASDGLIVSSYYSSNPCAGDAAQYDIVSDRCNVYGSPIYAFGTFECIAEADLMVMALYGPFDDESFTYPVCSPQEMDDAALAYEEYDAYYSEGPQITKQALSCTAHSAFDADITDYPFFQTVQCITGLPEPAGHEEYQDDAYGGPFEEWP